MPSDGKPDENPSPAPDKKKRKDFASTPALALELPFTIFGAIALGAAVGYYLDRWLHTKPWLTLLFGALGFFAGIREVLRRLPSGDNGSQSS